MRKFSAIFFLIFVTSVQLFSAVGKKEIRLRITEPSTSIFDETRVFLDLGFRQFVASEDGQKVFDSTSSAPLVYSFSSDIVPCFSNSYGVFTPDVIIPLGIKVAGNGTYKFSATLLDNFDPTSIIRLEDRSLSTFHDMRQGDYIVTINQAVQDEGRFFLHVSYPAQVSTTDAGCANDDGIISITPDNSITWSSCTLYDDTFGLGYPINNITGNFTFATLPFGDYNLVFAYGNYTAMKPVHINGRSIVATASASTLNASSGQTIQFFSTATNATDYLWDFGDGSQIDGVANPGFAYLQPGTYTVILTCSNNFGCTGTDTLTVNVSAATSIGTIGAENASVTMLNRSLRVLFNKPVDGYRYQLLNSLGQLVDGNALTQRETNVDLSSSAAGVYIVRITDGQKAFTQKVILQ